MSLYTPSTLSTTVGNIYVSSGSTVITWLSLMNYSVSNVTANIYAVPSAGSPTTVNQIVSNVEIGAGDTFQIYAGNEKLILGSGDTIQANCSANTSISTTISYTSA